MVFDDPIYMHSVWKVQFKTAILGRKSVDAEAVGSDSECDLGRWMHSEGAQKFAAKPGFQRAVSVHKRFHRLAADIAAAINRKDFDLAEKRVGPSSEYSAASVEIVSALSEIDGDMGLDFAAYLKNMPKDHRRAPPAA